MMREAMDETVRRGVPEQCARDFLLGHMNRGGSACPNTELALISGALQVPHRCRVNGMDAPFFKDRWFKRLFPGPWGGYRPLHSTL